MTLLHHAEALAKTPGKRFVDYEQPVLVRGRRVWRRFHDIDSENRALPEGNDPFEVIVRDMLADGIGRQGRAGAADSHLSEAAEVVDFAITWIEDRLSR